MSSPMQMKSGSILRRILSFFDETDIHVLVIAPPIIGFGGYFISLLVIEFFSEKPISEAYIYFGLGLAALIECIAGIAEIYKKEMPSSAGKIIKGNMAVISGVIIVVLFGLGGILLLIFGINILIIK